MKQLWLEFKQRPLWRKTVDIIVVFFAAAGAAIIGAWGLYQLGVTNNHGAVDKNYRSLMSVSEIEDLQHAKLTQEQIDAEWALPASPLLHATTLSTRGSSSTPPSTATTPSWSTA